MRIIPAIDIIGGKCVRLTKGDYTNQTIYSQHPLDVAKSFMDAGLKYLHLVDLDGAKAQHVVNYKIIETIAASTNLQIDFGGGLKSDDDVAIAFESGASQIVIGSLAVNEPAKFSSWLQRFGAEKVILGADCRDRKVAVHGWQQQSNVDIIEFISDYTVGGIKSVICTDIDKDGMLDGPSFQLYDAILKAAPVKLIASGGITSIDDLLRLKSMGCEGAIIGKAIYENRITLKQLEQLC